MSVAVFAADAELRDDHPDTYVVQKGDTLWDIAGRFLNHPWLWPEIWQANPQVQNPHLIYPGDVLSLVYMDGRPIVSMQDGGFGPRIRRESTEAIDTIPLSEVEPFLKRMRMLREGEAETLPYVVAVEENRLRATEGQLVYVRGMNVETGERVTLLRPTRIYYDVPDDYPFDWGQDESTHVEAADWEHERAPDTGFWTTTSITRMKGHRSAYLGHEVMEIAQGEVMRGGDPATVLVQYGDQEIKKGDLVVAGGALAYDLRFVPRAANPVPPNMRVVAMAQGMEFAGPHMVVALSRGAADGVENGQVYSIFRPGEVVRDEVAFAEDDVRTLFKPGKADVQLPEEFVGHVLVFRTFDRISYGLVMESIKPTRLGDVLHEPVR